ncbi:MAG TPA: protein-glutamate O-methyltransferase CheR [Ruminiclostridium sp.]|nr:protein-glutamate O-methyltransferase CheR [Ruminiclostridium sp.]
MISINDSDFVKLTQFIKNNFGINLTHKRTLIEGRLSNIILEKGFDNFSNYLDFVFNDKTGDEIVILINKLTTNHTYFMRESKHFEYMRETVLPFLAKNVRDHDLRIWSAGCSTGEEPYTLEMILQDFFGPEAMAWDTQVLATDISNRALGLARRGIYTADSIKEVPPMWKLNYFEKADSDGENFRVKEIIKNKIVFREFNLMTQQFPFRKKFHVIFCRNVMIYFDQPTKDALINRFYDMTEPGGYLFIGHSESVNREASRYKYIMPAVYRKEL